MVASDGVNAPVEQQVTLDISNLDDTAPAITSASSADAINENSGASQIVYTATAADNENDLMADGPIIFSLSDDSDSALTINAETGDVTLNSDPDHETKSVYNFTVIATDAAGNESSGQPVSLNINDLDDVAPLITSGNSVTVDENAPAQTIYNITYDDSGDDQQDPVAFGFLDNSGRAVTSLTIEGGPNLSINSSGQVTLNNTLDFEYRDTYSFIVLATNDQDFAVENDLDTRLGSVKQITLSVNNIDDTSPVIISSDSASSIDENGPNFQAVYTAMADDSADISDGISYGVAGVDADEVTIDANTGVVTLNSAADFEAQSQYSFVVTATDAAGNVSAAQTVTLDVNNLDDIAPSIDSGDTTVAIDENSGANQTIYTATADDSADISGGVTFSLAEGSDAALSIDADSGDVTLTTNPDFETQNQYSFAVIATDVAGNSSLEQSVTLDINNVDDTAPTITSSDSAIAVEENSGANQVIYNASATDESDVEYALLTGSDPVLSIDKDTGEVTLLENPDYENKPSYTFTVTATDSFGNISQEDVTVDVSNIDDTAPTITSGVSVAVLQTAGENKVVYQALANDSDDVSGGVSFTLSGVDAAEFEINSVTGAVTLLADPNINPNKVYNFDVVATDTEGNQSDPQSVTLTITAQDLVAPVINSADIAQDINENSGAGQVVYIATSIDESVVTYSLSGTDAGMFSLNSATGEVTLTANPDYEDRSEYSFDITATDSAGNVSDAKTVTLDINNLDEIAPTITSGETAISIDENSGANQVVYTVTANDSDDISDGVTFSLTEGSDAALSIDQLSGEVTLTADPNYEVQSEYTFAVVAIDVAGNVGEPKAVTLTINNIDDTAPTIISGETADSVDSESGAGQVVYTAIADDSDDISGGVTFSLSGVDAAKFAINDPSSGEISLLSNTDYALQNQYNFDVVATDAAGNTGNVKSVILKVDELKPSPATVNFTEDTGLATDNVSANGELTISGLKVGAKWEYSTNSGLTWILGANSAVEETATVIIADEGDYQVIVRQTNASTDSQTGEPRFSDSAMKLFIVDKSPPEVVLITADSDSSTVIVSYNEPLSDSTLPNLGDYDITQSGDTLTVSEITVDAENPQNLILTIENGLNSGAVRVEYTPSADLVQDIAGNATNVGFNSMIVSDGYIRGADVYIDRNEDGIADTKEFLPDYTTDEFGQLILPDSVLNAQENVGKQIIIQGGINMDTGAFNEIELRAPVGYEVINPLSTLVSKVIETGVSLEDAEAKLAQVFDIKLGVTEELATYDPLSDISENALANRVVVTQIATVLSVASAVNDLTDETTNVEDIVLTNLANIVVEAENNAEAIEIDANKVQEILSVTNAEDESELVEGVSTQILDRVQTAVEDMSKVLIDAEEAQDDGQDVVLDVEVEKVIKAQAIVIDDIAPKTPEISLTAESDLGKFSDDGLTKVLAPTVLIDFDTSSNDGRAVVAGDALEIFNNGVSVEIYTLTQSDIDRQFVYRDLPTLESGDFFVSASLTDRAGNSSFVSSLKIIVDIDPPVFSSRATADTVYENTAADQIIYTPMSSSEDLWKFELSEQSDTAIYFDDAVGAVKLSASPNFELQQQYSFTLIATDNAGNITEQQVTLDIGNVDELPPVFSSLAEADAINENTVIDQAVYIAQAADNLADITSGPITYSLSDDAGGLFVIDSATGEVRFNATADYEAFSSYDFTVVATDGVNLSSSFTVTLPVTNLDELGPVITSGETATAIPENIGSGEVVYTVQAVDDENDVTSGPITYDLTDTSKSDFDIDPVTGEVSLKANPDYESQADYSFEVFAIDGAGKLSNSLVVTLEIINQLDSKPTWESDSSAPAIDENSVANQVVYTAEATVNLEGDSEGAEGVGVTYSLSDNSNNAFTVNASSGEVTLTESPDFEENNSYSFSVIATDDLGNVSEPKVVTLPINNIDEAGPIITSGSVANAINENTASQVIYTAQADDDSSDVQSTPITYSLAEGNALDISIDSVSGEVTLNSGLDGDQDNLYEFTFVATDASGNQSSQTVALTVNDIDDTAPTITSGDTALTVVEDTDIGVDVVVYTATADDSADITNGSITFGLIGPDADLFSIDSNTGEVSLAKNPDYDTQASYSFVVTATDSVGLVGEQLVTMAVTNIDDTPPVITSGSSAQPISENSGVNQIVYTVQADDVDSNDTYTFDMTTIHATQYIEQGDVKQTFVANGNGSYSMELSLNESAVLENEGILENFDLMISYNHGDFKSFEYSPPMDETGEEPVANLMMNFAEPVGLDLSVVHIYFPEPLDLNVPHILLSINFDLQNEIDTTQIGVHSVLLNSDDQFKPSSSAIIYTNTDTGLTIDENTGEVKLASNPDYETQPVYNFIVTAEDSSGNISEAETVTLEIIDGNDLAPRMESPSQSSVDENIGADKVVYTAVANLNDAVYRLSDDSNGLFTINAETGEVTLSENPDFEIESSYSFSVISSVIDPDGQQLDSLELNVVLSINNVDDTKPSITSDGVAASIDENSPSGQIIYNATAVELGDDIAASPISFSLADGSHPALSINASTGEVTLSTSPDYESLAQYSFSVVATDAAGNASDLKTVTLDINNLDDTPPVITSGSVANVIDENSGLNQVVYTAVANDSFDTSVGVTFSLSGEDASAFSISNDEASLGEVTLLNNPDFEAQSEFSFTVIASDGVNAPVEKAITLDINNLDDTAPTIISGDIVDIDENSGANQIVYTAIADDSVEGSGALSYSLAADSNDLSINSTTGEVTLLVNPDYEQAQEYSFDVVATDGEDNDSEVKTIILTINDIDETPRITSDEMAVVLEGNGSNQVVYTATTNIEGAAFSLVDNTDYPEKPPVETVITLPEVSANTQNVYISGSEISADGSQVDVTYSYKSDDPTTTGVGFKINFDSSVLSLGGVSNVLSGAIASGDLADSGDSLTFGWASLFGGWPGSTDAELATITFNINSNSAEYTQLNVEMTSNTPDYTFYGQSQQIAIVTSSNQSSDTAAPELLADTQHVYVSESTKSADGSQITVKLSYLVDNPSLTGVGFSLGFDSSVLSLSGVSNVLNGAIASGDLADSGDSLAFGWASLFGDWPGSTDAELATITFDILEGASGTTALNIEKTSGTPSHEFAGRSHDVFIAPEKIASQLSIDDATGVVTLVGDADYELVPNYSFTVKADNGIDEAVTKDVGLLVADQLVTSAEEVYSGTPDSDIFALVDGSAEVTSGTGDDIFILAPSSNEESDSDDMITLVDFMSGVDSIDLSAALASVGYTAESELAQLTSANMSADILDLISSSDSVLDNVFGGSFDGETNILTLFADTNPELGVTEVNYAEIQLGDQLSVEDDDIVVSFIA